MTVMMTMDNAPLWLNVVIWVAAFWYYFMAGFVPAFYIAITKLFGMPLLQRWSNEVVIMLYPTKASFGKITEQYDPYIRYKKGIYWPGDPLQPEDHDQIPPKIEAKMVKLRQRYEELTALPEKTKKELKEMQSLIKQQKRLEMFILSVKPVNKLHIFTHAVNQEVTHMERRATKVDEILNDEVMPKHIRPHGIWLMQNPKLHFHRHYLILINPDKTKYKMIPVSDRQEFSIGFWHSIGVSFLHEQKGENHEIEGGESGNGSNKVRSLLLEPVTTNTVLQKMKEVQDYQNFSANRAYAILCKRRASLEKNFEFWVTGAINPIIFFPIIGGVAIIAVMFLFLHGGGSLGGSTPPTGGH